MTKELVVVVMRMVIGGYGAGGDGDDDGDR